MDPTTLLILIGALCAVAGFGVAHLWNRARPSYDEKRVAELEAQLAGTREQAERAVAEVAEREREVERLRATLMEAVQRGAAFEERARQVDELREVIREREQAIAQLQREGSQLRERGAELQTRLEEERQQSVEKLKLVAEAQQALENSFKSLSADALKSNNQSFLDLAKASLAEFQQGARGDLDKRQVAIDALIGPVKASLDKVDEKIGALEKAREQAYGEIRQQFTQMAEVQTQLRDETSNLVKALRQPHVRGRWGEVQLRRVVEMAGMMKHCDFVEQESAEGDEGKVFRPDLVVRLPGGRQIVVDSKAPISAYMDAHEAATEEVRKAKILLHAQLMRGHLQALAKKSYWEQFQPTPEVVVMFIPGEAFFSAALEADPELLDSGFGQNVIIASPASLMALLKAAAYGWRQESIADNAREISRLGQDLHGRLGVMAEHLVRLGKSLGSATENYNSAIASFESRVLVSARKFKELGATSQDAEIIELRPVEAGVRRLQSAAEKTAPDESA
jgi:DNA recombination protein RmuC